MLVKIPETCQKWKQMMHSGDQESRILANMENDPCLDEDVERAFFDRLAARGDPARPKQAWALAQQTVQADPDGFVCQGREVPRDLFAALFRLERVSSLRRIIPREVLDAKGLRDRELIEHAPEEELRSVVHEHHGPIQLGNKLQVVWVTDFARIETLLNDLPQIANRLGLQADRYILCAYNREDTDRSLQVPRALDGVDNPGFQVVVDCSADYGRTRPVNGPPEQGLPEAVHRSCSIVPRRWELGPTQ